MELRVLNYFVEIAKEKNISKAAEKLHLTQPTLSRQIKDLEDELGTILFIRSSRELQLTNEGQYLFNRANEILQLVNNTQEKLLAKDEISGSIFIGSAESASLKTIAKAIKSLSDNFPNLQFNFQSGNADEIFEDIDKGTLDFGIIFTSNIPKKYQYITLPKQDRWGVIVPKSHELAKVDYLSMSDVIKYPLIVSSQSDINYDIFADLGDYKIVATYNLLYNASLLVQAGVGIAIALDGIIHHPDLIFVPFNENTEDKLLLIWKKSSLTNSNKVFLEEVNKQIKKDN